MKNLLSTNLFSTLVSRNIHRCWSIIGAATFTSSYTQKWIFDQIYHQSIIINSLLCKLIFDFLRWIPLVKEYSIKEQSFTFQYFISNLRTFIRIQCKKWSAGLCRGCCTAAGTIALLIHAEPALLMNQNGIGIEKCLCVAYGYNHNKLSSL